MNIHFSELKFCQGKFYTLNPNKFMDHFDKSRTIISFHSNLIFQRLNSNEYSSLCNLFIANKL